MRLALHKKSINFKSSEIATYNKINVRGPGIVSRMTRFCPHKESILEFRRVPKGIIQLVTGNCTAFFL